MRVAAGAPSSFLFPAGLGNVAGITGGRMWPASRTVGPQRLLAVVLDHELVVDLDWNLIPLGKPRQLAAEVGVVLLEVGNVEGRMAKEVVLELLVVPALLLEGDDVANLDLVGRNVDLLSVDKDVAVGDELACQADRVAESDAVHTVVKPGLELDDEGVAGHHAALESLLIIVAKLLLENAIVGLELLLLGQLLAVLGGLPPLRESGSASPVHSLGMSTYIDTKSSALLKSRSHISSH